MKTDKPSTGRLVSIDALRGFVIVLMAVDHSRDFFGDVRIDCEDPTIGWPFFLTRWVTHFCAPTFVFLAGISAWLYGSRAESKAKLSRFLLTRGFWLLFLEFTVIRFSLGYTFTLLPWLFLVIAAIGTSMVVLSFLCFLRTQVVLAIGLVICCCHNILDPIQANSLGSLSFLWNLLHDGGPINGTSVVVGYPVLPWIGVICVGYGIGPVFLWDARQRNKFLLTAGVLMSVAFLLLRFTNGYGNPRPWTTYPNQTNHEVQTADQSPASDAPPGDSGSAEREQSDNRENPKLERVIHYSPTFRSFLTTQKYPPSLAYMLMTLGPAMIMLSIFDMASSSLLTRFFLVFGKVPLFFYILHFYLLSAGSLVAYWCAKGVTLFVFRELFLASESHPLPAEFGFQGLLPVYLAWLGVIIVTYPLCLLYGRFKKKARHWIWSYL